jgi:hypothetical protein
MSIKLDQARREISSLNAAFRARELLDPRFYRQLESAGFQPEKCVLVSITPDGAETYFGTLIRQDGRVFDFDIALAAPAHSEWTEITDTFLKDYRRLKKGRPWLPSIVAYDAFLLGNKG